MGPKNRNTGKVWRDDEEVEKGIIDYSYKRISFKNSRVYGFIMKHITSKTNIIEEDDFAFLEMLVIQNLTNDEYESSHINWLIIMKETKLSHITKHKKKYVRFFTFFFVIYLFRLAENYILFRSFGIILRIDLIHYIFFMLIATMFTIIAEETEKIIEREEDKIENIIKGKL